MVDEGGFIEHARFGGNYYGTSVKAVKDVAENGRICVLDIELEVYPSIKLVCQRHTYEVNLGSKTSAENRFEC